MQSCKNKVKNLLKVTSSLLLYVLWYDAPNHEPKITMHCTATRSDKRTGLELTQLRNFWRVFEFPEAKTKDKGGANSMKCI
jgi:hypothetical protein